MTFSHILPKTLDASLTETLSQLRSYVYLEQKQANDKTSPSSVKNIEYGKSNAIRIQPHPVKRQFYDSATFLPISKEEPNIRIAISTTREPTDKPDKKSDDKIEKQKEETLKLLSSYENNHKDAKYSDKSSTLFIQHFLYCDKKRKISIAAESDLFDWLEAHIDKEDFTEDQFKKIIALTLLAVQTLHSGLMVHRDIKFENFLIHPILQNYIELADLDTVSSIYDSEVPSEYTPSYLPPECRKIIRSKIRIDKNLYEDIAKKPVDCYAIGHSIHMFADNISNDSISAEHIILLLELAEGLKHPDPAKRLTIKEAMDHSYFGPDENTRKAYFDNLRKEYQYDIFYDGYYYNRKHFYPAYGDAFFLLPKWIKKLYFQAASLQTQIKLMSDEYPSLGEDYFQAVNKQIAIVRHSLNKMDRLDVSHNALKDILRNLQECTQQAELLLKSGQFVKQDDAEVNASPTKRRRI